jgi:hypothetical protein
VQLVSRSGMNITASASRIAVYLQSGTKAFIHTFVLPTIFAAQLVLTPFSTRRN